MSPAHKGLQKPCSELLPQFRRRSLCVEVKVTAFEQQHCIPRYLSVPAISSVLVFCPERVTRTAPTPGQEEGLPLAGDPSWLALQPEMAQMAKMALPATLSLKPMELRRFRSLGGTVAAPPLPSATDGAAAAAAAADRSAPAALRGAVSEDSDAELFSDAVRQDVAARGQELHCILDDIMAELSLPAPNDTTSRMMNLESQQPFFA
eukprot:SAG22_NODE_4623_length_1213_cov_0.772890_2_plen_206_part_00